MGNGASTFRVNRTGRGPTACIPIHVLTIVVCLYSAPNAHAAHPSRTAVEGSPIRTPRQRVEADIAAALSRNDADAALQLVDDNAALLGESRRLYWSGRACLVRGDHTTARRRLAASLKLRPRNADAQFWLGRAYLSAGAAATAADHFRKAYHAGLESAELQHDWAAAHRDMGQLLGRVTLVQWPASDEKGPAPGDRHADGIIVSPAPGEAGRYVLASDESALFHVAEALRLNPERGESHLLAAEIWAGADCHETAIQHLEKALPRLPKGDQIVCHEAWSRSCLALADLDGYLEHARLAMECANRVDAEAMARCYDRAADEAALRGQLSRQVQYLKLGVRSHASASRCIRLADALLAAQRPADAVTYLRLAERSNPTREERSAIAQRLSRTAYLTSPGR